MKFAAAFACTLMCLASARAQVRPVPDRVVKAAYLARFANFVTWPGRPPRGPFTVCLSPSHEFGSAVDQAVQGTTVGGRPVVVRHLTATEAVTACELLYVATPDADLLPMTRRQPILTIGEDVGFCQRGGVINLRVIAERVRFEVSLTNARAAGLSIDSQLLRLAMAVYGGRQ